MGQGHPCACRLLADHPHGSWSQVSPQLGRRPGREPGTPFPRPTPTSQGVLGWRPADPLTPLAPPSSAHRGGGQLWQVVTRRALAH